MNHSARLPSQRRPTASTGLLSSLAAALRDTLCLFSARQAHRFFRPPSAFQYPVSQRAQRFMRGGE
jgi:cytochrome c-type biogenesis protein CcmE